MKYFDPKQLKKGDIAFVVIVSIIGIFTMHEFTFGTASASGQYEIWMNWVENVELTCEMIQDVPHNYYTGKIDSDTMRPVVVMLLGNYMSIEQQELIKSTLQDKIRMTPCYEEHLLYLEKD